MKFPASPLVALLLATLTAGCASQNAMSLLPENVKLDLEREKAAKQGPISVDAMMAKARDLHPEKDKQVASDAQVDSTKTAALPEKSQPADDAVQTAYADVPAHESPTKQPRRGTGELPSELFQQAMLLSHQTPSEDQTSSVDDVKEAAAAQEWQRLIAKQDQATKSDQIDPQLASANTEAPLVLPLSQIEIIPVNFNAARDQLIADDDLKVKLLHFGKRVPLQITIGKIEGLQGFQVMQSAIGLGEIIVKASGGSPTISYDPTLSPGAAELRYPAVGSQS